MQPFTFYNPVRLYFGEGEFDRLGEEASALGRKPLVVTGRRAMRQAGWLQKALDVLSAAGLEPAVFDQVRANPTDAIVEQGAQVARSHGCDLVIGLGGGSSMDAAKAIAVRATHDEPIAHFVSAGPWGEKRVPGPQTLPIICVTSTAGTSSELTRFAVVTVQETPKKAAVVGDAIYARVAIADPRLTYTAPPRVTAATGIDTLCHAVEAYLARVASPITDACAERAIELVGKWLPAAVADGSNADARRGMLLANVFAGYALSQVGGTLVHALEHPISAIYPEVAHGEGLAALLPAYLRRMAAVVPEKTARVAQLLGAVSEAADVAEAAAAAERAVVDLLEAVGLRVTLSDLGVAREALGDIVAGALDYMAVAVEKTPGEWPAEALIELLEECL